MRHAALLCIASLMLSACTNLTTVSSPPALDASQRLQAHRWELVYWEGTPVPHGDNGEPVILTFADGRVSGHTGCNRSSAGYELDAAAMQLRILAPLSTRMACEEGRMAFEASLLKALQGVRTLRLDGPHLYLEAPGQVALKLHERELQ
ncbi:MAG: META domain-containing protein [Sinobacteraceae bacterium]|nr:META domain-containing protein [Nevskiaceae bacterium]